MTPLEISTPPEISVVVPCHNEQGNLRPLVEGIVASLQPLGRTFEIVIVDDGSTDASWRVLQELVAGGAPLRALRLARNCGQSAALWAGLQGARGRICVTLDADLQNPPAEIPRLLAALEQSDCVCGTRVAARARGDSWLRVASSRVANGVRNWLTHETISDAGCCFRAFRRECVARVRFFRGAHRFLPTLIRMEGFRVTELPIAHHPRGAGRTHYGVWNRLFASFGDLLAVRWIQQRRIDVHIAETLERKTP